MENTNHLFDIDKINKQIEAIEKNPPKHYIGVYEDGTVFCYTLIMRFGDIRNVIMSKQFNGSDKSYEFNEEVGNLAKYFNAEIVHEKIKFRQFDNITYSEPTKE